MASPMMRNNRLFTLVLFLALAGMLLVGTIASAQSAPILDEITDPAERDRVSALIEEAKREGTVVYWTAGGTPELAEAVARGFVEKYGLGRNFRVQDLALRTSEIISRSAAEIEAGNVSVDIISGAIYEYYFELMDKGEIMYYESPEYAAFPMKGTFDIPGYIVTHSSWSPVMMYNPRWVDPIHDYEDILKPEHRGLIIMGDGVRSSSYLTAFRVLKDELGEDFMRELAKLNPIMSERSPDIVERVVSGERPIAFTGNQRVAYIAAQEGADIKVVFPERGVVLMPTPYVILKRAPHPAAAKLFIDYLYSEEVQRLFQEMSGYIMARPIPVPDDMRDYSPPIDEIRVLPTDWEGLADLEGLEADRELFRSIFNPGN